MAAPSAGVIFPNKADKADLDAAEREVRAERELTRKVREAEKFQLTPVDAKILQRCVLCIAS